MKFPSIEIRWFWAGEAPPSVRLWFLKGREVSEPSARTDHYLLGVGPDLNIKLREGRIEVKQRQGPPHRFELSARRTGWQERWIKWSFALDRAPGYIAGVEEDPGAWLAVHKRRYLRTFAWEEDGIQETGNETFLPVGCNAELTELVVENRTWYSIGLEAFGEKGKDEEVLLTAAASLLAGPEAPEVPLERSQSYAAWISEFYPKFVRQDRQD